MSDQLDLNMPIKDVLEYDNGERKIRLINVKFLCTRCGKFIFGSKVGLRVMPDGWIRSQPQCKACRHLPPERDKAKKDLPKADVLVYEEGKIRLMNAKFLCTNPDCDEVWVWGSKVGLRTMPDGWIRSQPQCKKCRGRYGSNE